jgi:hypothetical protein
MDEQHQTPDDEGLFPRLDEVTLPGIAEPVTESLFPDTESLPQGPTLPEVSLPEVSLPELPEVSSLPELPEVSSLPELPEVPGVSSLPQVPPLSEVSLPSWQPVTPEVLQGSPHDPAVPIAALTAISASGAAAASSTTIDLPVPPKKSRKLGRFAVLGVGLAGVVGGGAFAYTQFTGKEKANTPEQAVEQFYTSISQGDAIGLAQSLSPGERDVLLDSMVPMIGEMSRLGLLDENIDLNKVKGVDGTLTDFAATSTMLRDDLAAVKVTSGNLVTNFNPKDFPIGDLIRDAFGDEIDNATPTSDSTSLVNNNETPIVVEKVGRRWYVSFNQSVAESWRNEDPTRKVPAKWAGVAPKGADSPEAAVTEMMQAVGDLKTRRILELVPPDEIPALHDYAGEFLPDVEEAAAEANKYFKLKVSPQLRTEKITSDRSLVSLIDVPFDLSGEFEGNVFSATYKAKKIDASLLSAEGEKSSLSYQGECLTIVVEGDEEKACGQEELGELFSNITGQPVDTSQLFGESGNTCTKGLPKPKLGMVTVKRDGKWYVSPARTMLDSITAYMKTFDRKTIDCLKNQAEGAIDEFNGVLNGTADPSLDDSTFLPPQDPSSSPIDDTLPDGFETDPFDTIPVGEFPFDTIPSGQGPPDAIPPDTVPSDTVPPDTIPPDTIVFEESTSDPTEPVVRDKIVFDPAPAPAPTPAPTTTVPEVDSS